QPGGESGELFGMFAIHLFVSRHSTPITLDEAHPGDTSSKIIPWTRPPLIPRETLLPSYEHQGTLHPW
ncbi:MAG: hypothetical protein KJN81_01910, partial [Acidimicrobiia bacterium]|nr:hypothetical protein [Acidimicrobiia bacterium]